MVLEHPFNRTPALLKHGLNHSVRYKIYRSFILINCILVKSDGHIMKCIGNALFKNQYIFKLKDDLSEVGLLE